jgi:hypothetical protein
MKKILFILIFLAAVRSLSAQVPEKISYQAVIRDPAGQLVVNQTIGIRISILRGMAAAVPVYVETHAVQTNANGLVTLEIGGGAVESGAFGTIDWADGTYYLQTETDPSGGTNYTISGMSQLLSVPYALHAATADRVTGGGSLVHYPGELFGGGIVVAVWKEAGTEHGLIASLADISATALWSDVSDTQVGPTAQSPVDGRANTAAIIAQSANPESAAWLCEEYEYGGFTDWYLPAAWELDQCYNAALVVNTVLGPVNGFRMDVYWASTEDPFTPNAGMIKLFYSGKSGSVDKGVYTRVRAVRRF